MRPVQKAVKHKMCGASFFVLYIGFGICFIRGMSDKALIDQLGGIPPVSAATGAKASAVSNWRLDGRKIPWKHKPAIARLAAEKAVNLPADFWGAPA